MYKNSIKTLLVLIFSVLTAMAGLVYAGEKYQLKYNFSKDKTFKYKTILDSEITQEMMGQEMQILVNGNTVVNMTSEGTDKNGNLILTLQFDSMNVNIKNPMFDSTLTNPAGVIGKKIRQYLTPFGKIIKTENVDSLKMPQFTQQFTRGQGFLARLPNQPIEIGVPFKQTSKDTMNVMNGNIVAESEIEYTAQGTEKKLGYNCLKITFKGTINMEGNSKFQGMNFFIEGDGDIEGTIFFAPQEGLLISHDTINDLEMTAAMTGQQNLTIPISQSIKTSTQLVP
ncbi:MAG: hypothetical protein D6813_01065 [Calditrichaeota bacterium]|nr:MAG: hypothetical protein D6813_01065 [Calditrichota bacterium]